MDVYLCQMWYLPQSSLQYRMKRLSRQLRATRGHDQGAIHRHLHHRVLLLSLSSLIPITPTARIPPSSMQKDYQNVLRCCLDLGNAVVFDRTSVIGKIHEVLDGTPHKFVVFNHPEIDPMKLLQTTLIGFHDVDAIDIYPRLLGQMSISQIAPQLEHSNCVVFEIKYDDMYISDRDVLVLFRGNDLRDWLKENNVKTSIEDVLSFVEAIAPEYRVVVVITALDELANATWLRRLAENVIVDTTEHDIAQWIVANVLLPLVKSSVVFRVYAFTSQTGIIDSLKSPQVPILNLTYDDAFFDVFSPRVEEGNAVLAWIYGVDAQDLSLRQAELSRLTRVSLSAVEGEEARAVLHFRMLLIQNKRVYQSVEGGHTDPVPLLLLSYGLLTAATPKTGGLSYLVFSNQQAKDLVHHIFKNRVRKLHPTQPGDPLELRKRLERFYQSMPTRLIQDINETAFHISVLERFDSSDIYVGQIGRISELRLWKAIDYCDPDDKEDQPGNLYADVYDPEEGAVYELKNANAEGTYRGTIADVHPTTSQIDAFIRIHVDPIMKTPFPKGHWDQEYVDGLEAELSRNNGVPEYPSWHSARTWNGLRVRYYDKQLRRWTFESLDTRFRKGIRQVRRYQMLIANGEARIVDNKLTGGIYAAGDHEGIKWSLIEQAEMGTNGKVRAFVWMLVCGKYIVWHELEAIQKHHAFYKAPLP
ncbi:hypothetical protein BDZ89DRAFT_1037163 [Hymenopellis radicata]|nr:hypothetical protein BDZ89DRAFT_1037163 [Hymenopellis radicata]